MVSLVSSFKVLLATVPTNIPLVSSYLIRELFNPWDNLIADPFVSLLICTVLLLPLALTAAAPNAESPEAIMPPAISNLLDGVSVPIPTRALVLSMCKILLS